MTIRVYTEGEAEEKALGPLLRRELEALRDCRWRIETRCVPGKERLLKQIAKRVRLAVETDGVDAVFALVDFHPDTRPLEELKAEMGRHVDKDHRGRFHPHVAVHDLEAWILADHGPLQRRLHTALKGWDSPESVDMLKPPKRHINELFLSHIRHAYKETIDAPKLLGQADTNLIARKCPHFKAFRDDLLSVAGIDPAQFEAGAPD